MEINCKELATEICRVFRKRQQPQTENTINFLQMVIAANTDPDFPDPGNYAWYEGAGSYIEDIQNMGSGKSTVADLMRAVAAFVEKSSKPTENKTQQDVPSVAALCWHTNSNSTRCSNHAEYRVISGTKEGSLLCASCFKELPETPDFIYAPWFAYNYSLRNNDMG